MKTLNSTSVKDSSGTVLQKIKLSDGSTILFEASSSSSKTLKEVSNQGTPTIDQITSKIKAFSADIHKAFTEVKPDKVSIKFGIEVSAEPGNIISLIIKGSGKSNLEVTLEWNAKD